jgi:hypothetical protein
VTFVDPKAPPSSPHHPVNALRKREPGEDFLHVTSQDWWSDGDDVAEYERLFGLYAEDTERENHEHDQRGTDYPTWDQLRDREDWAFLPPTSAEDRALWSLMDHLNKRYPAEFDDDRLAAARAAMPAGNATRAEWIEFYPTIIAGASAEDAEALKVPQMREAVTAVLDGAAAVLAQRQAAE